MEALGRFPCTCKPFDGRYELFFDRCYFHDIAALLFDKTVDCVGEMSTVESPYSKVFNLWRYGVRLFEDYDGQVLVVVYSNDKECLDDALMELDAVFVWEYWYE